MKKILFSLFLLINIITYAQQQVVICGDDNVTFTYQTSVLNGMYIWTLNQTEVISNTSFVTINWNNYGSGTYQLEVNFTDISGCIAEPVKYDVEVSICEEFKIFIPNAFSPNDDMYNDFFMVSGFGFDPNSFIMSIYDRWGMRLYYTTDINRPWYGIDDETKLPYPQGIYTYRIMLCDIHGILHEYSGSITLLQ